MRRTLLVAVAAIVALATVVPAVAAGGIDAVQDAQECEYPFADTDATGEEVTVDESPERVVALQPSDAQTAYEIGAEEKVVGMPVSQYTDYLDRGDETDVTEDDGLTVVAERVIDLDPDVVIAANTALYQEGLIEQLRDAGLTVYVFEEARSIDDVRDQVRTTGRLAGECEGAEETVDRMDERLEIVETAVEGEERPLAYYAMGDGFTTGSGTFQHELLTTAGVENLGERAGLEGWQEISDEVVVEEDPEWIIYPNWADEPPVAESVRETTAYQEENFVAVDDNYMSQPAPRIVLALEQITEAVHPEAYEEARDAVEQEGDATNESDDDADEDGADGNESDDGAENETTDANETAGDDETDDATDEDGDDGGGGAGGDDSIPGFGVPVAVAAVLAAIGLLARRRA